MSLTKQSSDLVVLHLQQVDYFGALNAFQNLSIANPTRKAVMAQWLNSLYEVYHFQFHTVFNTLSDMYQENWISHDQFTLAWHHWEHLIQHDGITVNFLLDSLQDAVHHIELYLAAGDYLAFLSRIYRFRELLILFLLLKAGKTDRVQYFQPGRAPDYQQEIENAFLNHELSNYYGVYMFLQSKQLTDVIHLRNHSLVGHGRLGVTSTSVWENYEGKWYQNNSLSVQSFLHDMTILFQDLGVELTENPYRILAEGVLQAIRAESGQAFSERSMIDHATIFKANLAQYQYHTLLNQASHALLPTKLQQSLDFALSLMLGDLSVGKCQAMHHTFLSHAQAYAKESLESLFIPLAKGDQISFLNYLLAQLHVFQQRHDYGELWIRVYRLMEELMIYYLGYDVDARTAKLVPRDSHAAAIPLQRHTFSGLMEVIDQRMNNEPTSGFLSFVRAPWWGKVAELHRQSIVGHGISTITKEYLETQAGISLDALIEALTQAIQSLGVPVLPNYFDQINRLITWKFHALQQAEHAVGHSMNERGSGRGK